MDLKPGQMLGSYRIEERLVSGGMAKVYRALQASTGRELAIKVLPVLHADAAGVARFEREIRVLAGLQHPHILALIDAGEQGPFHYLVMPLVRRGDLGDRIAREDGPLPLPFARRIVLQLCDALDYAHAQGVVHRDLKPANVLLDEGGNCLLTDFGIAQPEGAERLTAVGMAVGTPEYIAPEQAAGRADARSDLYALGLILFQLVTGRLPFAARGSAAWVQAHRDAPVPAPRALNAALPPALDAVVLKALAKSPDDRFQSAAEFAAALRSALPEAIYAEGALPLPDATPTRRTRRPRHRHPLALAAFATALVIAGVAAWRVAGTPTTATDQNAVAPRMPAAAVSPPATNAPAPVAGPAGAGDARPEAAAADAPPRPATAYYDSFADARYDRRYDPARWQVTSTTAAMRFEQRDGALHVWSRERDHGLYAELAGARLAAVSARVRLAAPVAASQASIGVTISRLERPGQWISCYAYATRNATASTPVCTDQRRSEFRSGPPAEAGAWHDVTLRIDAGAARVVLSADGQALGELPLAAAADPQTWYVTLSGWSADGNAVEGDIARLVIDQRP